MTGEREAIDGPPVGEALGRFDVQHAVPFGTDDYHPEWAGGNVFGLQRVRLDDGAHLVGNLGMYSAIYDFTAGEVVYDFSEFGEKPRSGGDTYGAACEWRGRYYWGGWIMAPNPTGGFDPTNRYAYLLETPDLETWNVVLEDRGGDHDLTDEGDGYPAEVSDLVPTPPGVYVFRADDGGSGVGVGVWKYDGEDVVAVDEGTKALFGCLHRDHVVYQNFENPGELRRVAVGDDTVSRFDVSAVGVADRGDGDARESFDFASGKLVPVQSVLVAPGRDAVDVLDGAGNSFRVPYLIHPVQDDEQVRSRDVERTSPMHAAGGVLFAKNNISFNHEDAKELTTGYLSYFDGQSFRIVGTGRWIADLALYNGRVYYGTSSSDHDSTLVDVNDAHLQLASIPIDALNGGGPQPPVCEPVEYDPYRPQQGGYKGLLGGLPTLGYGSVKLSLWTDSAGTATVFEWDAWRRNRELVSREFAADEDAVIDLSSEVSGGIVGVRFDSRTRLRGAFNLQ